MRPASTIIFFIVALLATFPAFSSTVTKFKTSVNPNAGPWDSETTACTESSVIAGYPKQGWTFSHAGQLTHSYPNEQCWVKRWTGAIWDFQAFGYWYRVQVPVNLCADKVGQVFYSGMPSTINAAQNYDQSTLNNMFPSQVEKDGCLGTRVTTESCYISNPGQPDPQVYCKVAYVYTGDPAMGQVSATVAPDSGVEESTYTPPKTTVTTPPQTSAAPPTITSTSTSTAPDTQVTSVDNSQSPPTIVYVGGGSKTTTSTTTTVNHVDGSSTTTVTTNTTYVTNNTVVTTAPGPGTNPTTQTTEGTTVSGGGSTTTTNTSPDGGTTTTTDNVPPDPEAPCEGPDCSTVKIDEEGTPSGDSSMFNDQFSGIGFDEYIAGLSDDPGFTELDIDPLQNFPAGGGCQTLTITFFGKTITIPSADGCSRLHQVKELLSWFVYIMTVYTLVMIALGIKSKEVA